MKKILFLALPLLMAANAFGQNAKKTPPPADKTYTPAQRALRQPSWKANVPPSENNFNLPAIKRQTMPAFTPVAGAQPAIKVVRAENGMPILFQGKTAASGTTTESTPAANRAVAYVASLSPAGIIDAATEFVVKSSETDDQGMSHVRLEQVFQNVPVYGAEVVAHAQNGVFELLNGRYFPTPKIASIVPALDIPAAITAVKTDIGVDKVKSDWTADQLKFAGGTPFKTTLVIYHPNNALTGERLVWLVEAHPNVLRRVMYFVDAQTGAIIHHFDNTCEISGGRHTHAMLEKEPVVAETPENVQTTLVLDGPVTASGQDLLNVNRTFGAWQSGTQILLLGTDIAMYNGTASQMPNDPVGAIVTLNALNTSPQTPAFNYDFVSSATLAINNKNAISAHYNSIKSYDYYRTTFGRNSIDGVGGNIMCFVNVSEDNGSSMENAFWNGAAMWYGNGGSAFKQLARGLDVGGHEMTHGVIEKTANLEYQDESGALNESFADVFGAMIDRDDWQIGEDVMQSGVSPSGALRSLQDPHNGDVTNGSWWQPRHVNEKYTGTQDNGGVHINSGIPNYAFYLFANNAAVGKDKAEKVYYRALKDYLVKSSQFVDARIAVLQAATDLYGASVANIAAAAFDAVGITGTQAGGNYLGQLSANPGQDFILLTPNDNNKLSLAVGNGTILGTVYNGSVGNRPSIRDNGEEYVFVDANGNIIIGALIYNTDGSITPQSESLSEDGIWRNAAISKEGRYLAAITNSQDNRIYIYDLFDPFLTEHTFFLYNPSYTTGQYTDDVEYPDVLEFDYSSDYLMYDARNALTNTQGEDIGYWDIGFLQFRENQQIVDGTNAYITKLFSGLPENTSVGDPAFAKNSPYIIAFDFIDDQSGQVDIYGSNTETGDYDVIVSDNGAQGWPNYNRLDSKLLFESSNTAGTVYTTYLQPLAASKIQPQGAEAQFVANYHWGIWFANGDRGLEVVGTDEPIGSIADLAVSPNPTSGVARLTFTADAAVDAQITVSNLLGQRIFNQETNVAAGANQLDINLETLPAGTYLVRMAIGGANAVVKLVKQ